ncbi:sigma-70 family RNA polymerase sigma factor [Nocardiopsis ansamitocini]|uniref:RNA polymerase sigma factor n=1 Tax=Nocardiopsis ansamitocini TaxID=1670832 RepID=A0A9W6P7W6_9ACTN|nr:sigma-70 family RNA polymerase sigma factor [Nocardiopsis ansamitocini]GLU48623.1 RNA polymerase sigma factor [Nocardiopsis ansamitocini]
MEQVLADDAFLHSAAPFRRELLVHCYRMLGSVHDAEDLVQETYLRAWRSYDGFEARSSIRTWLYRIATNVCLTALSGRARRPLPTGLGGSPADPEDDPRRSADIPWLHPLPDVPVAVEWGDPASVVTQRHSLRLALVAALQYLPPRQRAVLVLRDVLQWRAAEVAQLLGTTTTAVNSSLQRARARIAEAAPAEESVLEPEDAEYRRLLDRYAAAFERKDVAAITRLLTADAVWEMPPFASWYRGPAAVGRHLAARCPGGPGDFRLLPAGANGQPAFGVYLRDGGEYRPFLLQVLTPTRAGFSHVVSFLAPRLFVTFGLPPSLAGVSPATPPGEHVACTEGMMEGHGTLRGL